MKIWLKSLTFGGGVPIVLLCIVLLTRFVFRKRRLGNFLAIGSLFVISLMVSPGVSNWMVQPLLEKGRQLDHANCLTDPICQAQAIVVTSSGINKEGFLSEATWWRTRKGIELWKAGKAPLLVFSGGRPDPDYPFTEAETMAQEAKRLGVPEKKILLENDSGDTHENATMTFSLLRSKGITKIVLVTSRVHLPRANPTFRKAGFETIPIAAETEPKKETKQPLYPPSWMNAANCEAVLNEYLGYAFYALAGWL